MAARAHIYSGQGFSLQRDKNRFVLPNPIRATVKESSGGKAVLCLAKHDRWTCLTGFGLSRVDDFAAQIAREEETALKKGVDFDRDLRSMQLYGFFEVPFDGSGRFVMPEHLASLANIEGELFFQGAGEFFTVWNPDELASMPSGLEFAQAACANLRAKETAKAKKG
ncbi:hypothetical protein GCM10011371_11320 [Novosphingobium marinum]|uniref:MraZ protein n=1 Tax=Novosphingobium marinum TaxID=1514948 RepID=A0A7Z0BSS3_9SPHN|nr:division/cell wall cluster transcriptional repressor MraZ [Novosphingobium marinum]NYH95241.1 MraZ protein [Novosphingobium marinum]GGC25458.1 hypothetical protein GCM10011371_11320 [Novosphingobium marinum]